jgi:hypothetical protein
VEEATADVAGIARGLYLELERSHDKTLANELFLVDEQRKWFLEMQSIPGKKL